MKLTRPGRFSPLLALFLLFAAHAPAQAVWYVDDSAAGADDGTSWQDAFTDLQSALAVAGPADSVWVAEGVYRPAASDRAIAFMPSGYLYGGFLGDESSVDARAGSAANTILTGDLLGDDGPGFANRSDNSHNVLRSEYVVTLPHRIDGFTVRGGHADGPGILGQGGGMHLTIELTTLVIVDCIFEDNFALSGGALYLEDAEEVRSCVFRGNRASGSGGAVHSEPTFTAPLFTACRFVENEAQAIGGGALYGYAGGVASCEFVGNRADGTQEGGGGARLLAPFVGCTFHANTALASVAGGGGLSFDASWSGSIFVSGSILWANEDASGGGSDAQLTNLPPGALDHSCVQSWDGSHGGEGNLWSDPRFRDPLGADGVAGTADDDLSLRAGSPCIDRASTASWSWQYGTRDVADHPRLVNAIFCGEAEDEPDLGLLDIGARERQELDGSTNHCAPTASSAGLTPRISIPCGASLAAGPFDLRAQPAPDGFGLFLAGPDAARVLWNGGALCVAGPHLILGAARVRGGVLEVALDPAAPPFAPHLVPGSTWTLQAWIREDGGGVAASDAATLVIRP